MSSCKVEKKRRQEKFLETTALRGTVPTQQQVCDFTEETDIMKGEWLVNFIDGVIQNRVDDGVGYVPFVIPTASDDEKATVYDHANKKFILAAVGTNLNLFGDVLFVSENGDDNTAVKGDLAKPWADVMAAKDAASANDIIYVFPGTYLIDGSYGSGTGADVTILKDGVTWALSEGCTISSSVAEPMLNDTTGKTTKICGQGRIVNTAGDESSWFHNIYVQHADANHNWQFKEMYVQSFFAWQGGGLIKITCDRFFSVRAGQYRFRPQMADTKLFFKGDIIAQGIGSPEIGGDPDTLATWWQCGQVDGKTFSGNQFEFRGNMYNYGWGGSQFAGMIWAISESANQGFKVDVRGDVFCPFTSVTPNKQENVMVGVCNDMYFEGNVYAPNHIALWGLDNGGLWGSDAFAVIRISKAVIKSEETATDPESTLLYERVRGHTGKRIEFHCNAVVTDGEGISMGGNTWTEGVIISGKIDIKKNNTDCFKNVSNITELSVEDLKVLMPSGTTGFVYASNVAATVIRNNGNVKSNNTNVTDANTSEAINSTLTDVKVR